MNQILPDRRSRTRTATIAAMEVTVAGRPVPARLTNISFAGLQGRLGPDVSQLRLDEVETVRLEDLPPLPVSLTWQKGDTFGLSFDAPERAGRIIAGFIELFGPPAAR